MTITKQIDISMCIDLLIENCRTADEKQKRYVKVDRVDLSEIIDILVEAEKREKEEESEEALSEESTPCLGEGKRPECFTCKNYIFARNVETCSESAEEIFTSSMGIIDKRCIAMPSVWKHLYDILRKYEDTEPRKPISVYIDRVCEILEEFYKDIKEEGEDVEEKPKILSEE